jgi:uncharacterized repeat protein (TIGR02543 family)
MRHIIALLVFCVAITIVAPSQVLTTLTSFTGPDGYSPSTLVFGTDGNLYGTTAVGGSSQGIGFGTVFTVTTAGALTSLYSFQGGNDGGGPQAALVQGSDGNFYGTTVYGGSSNLYGTVFRVTPTGSLTTIHSFNLSDGYGPYAALVQGTDGLLYGSTIYGGPSNAGTIFKTTLDGALSDIHTFTSFDGGMPYGGLVQGTDGNFYGTTRQGGVAGYGTVYRITPGGDLTTLHSFVSSDGEYPYAGVVQAMDGNFYGATYYGGTYQCGVVFKMTPQGAFTVLHQFNCTDGWYANSLVAGRDGNVYGTTIFGGNLQACVAGCGTIFQITPQGQLTTIYNFIGPDGQAPIGMVERQAGEFFGTTGNGGSVNDGTVFHLVAYAVASVVKSGNGTVSSADGHIYCGTECSYKYPGGAHVTLSAVPAPGYTFNGWTGCDNANGSFCSVTMTDAKNVTATFASANVTLTSLTFKPSYVKGGQLSAGTLTLSGPAPPGGATVALTSDHPGVAHPPSFVFVPGGKAAVQFAVNTFPVRSNTAVTITAKAGASQVNGMLAVGTSSYRLSIN